ncbi:MAG: carbohydrate kinase family protein [Candidatus Thorarchaeota archaeon]|nr:carbohydrate kinase family protein [Candidatus Thorarchaeota archaeon]
MEILVVGHLSRDFLVTPEMQREALGGGTAYAMLAPTLEALGAGIVTRVGRDFEQQYIDSLRNSGLDLTGMRTSGPTSTRFVNEYDEHGERTQRIEALAPPLRGEDYLPHHYDTNIVHFCPLTNDEVHLSCIEAMAFRRVLVSLDVQGFLRPSRIGPVEPVEWGDPERVLRHVDVMKADEEEILLAMQTDSEEVAVQRALQHGPQIVIVTRERKGSTIFTTKSHWDIPAVVGSRLVDETGAGDTYMVGFLLEYVRSGDVRRAGLFGATCASFNLEHVGPYHMPSRKQVEERMLHYM